METLTVFSLLSGRIRMEYFGTANDSGWRLCSEERMATRRLLLLLVFTIAQAHAALSQGFAGCWTLDLDGRVFLTLQLAHNGIGWGGELSMPSKFEVGSGGKTFSRVSGPIQIQQLEQISAQGDLMNFTTPDKQKWILTITPSTRTAQLRMLGAPLDPWTLRQSSSVKVSTEWNLGATYSALGNEMPSAAMLAIYLEDQRDRSPGNWTAERWTALAKADQLRRNMVRNLLDTGELRTTDDFTRAAFVFQHGNSKDDFLLAHTLALAALARGDKGAAWIAATSLDAYLQSIGQPQVLGTRFVIENGVASPKAAFDSQLIPQQLRQQIGVPSLEVGAQQFLKSNQ